MKKPCFRHRSFVCLLLAVFLLFLQACSSVPEKQTEDDCMVVMLCETKNPENLPIGRMYKFHFTGEIPPVSMNSSYSTVIIREPGIKLKAITSSVAGNYTGERSEHEAGVLLPYEPGKLVVAEFVFVRTYKKVSDNTVQSSIDLRKITREERERLLAKLRLNKKYSAWFL